MKHFLEFVLLIVLIGCGVAAVTISVYGIVLWVQRRRYAPRRAARRVDPVWDERETGQLDAAWDRELVEERDSRVGSSWDAARGARWEASPDEAPPFYPAPSAGQHGYGPMSGLTAVSSRPFAHGPSLEPLPAWKDGGDWPKIETSARPPWDSAQFPIYNETDQPEQAAPSVDMTMPRGNANARTHLFGLFDLLLPPDSAPQDDPPGVMAISGIPEEEDAGAADPDRSAAPAPSVTGWVNQQCSHGSPVGALSELQGQESTLPTLPSTLAGDSDLPAPEPVFQPVDTVADALGGEEKTGRVVSPASTRPVPPWPVTQIIIIKQTIIVPGEHSERLADYADTGWAHAQHGRYTGDMDWVQRILDAPYDHERGELVLA